MDGKKLRRSAWLLRMISIVLACTALAFVARGNKSVNTDEFREAESEYNSLQVNYSLSAGLYNMWADTYNQVLGLARSAASLGLSTESLSTDVQKPLSEMAKLEREMEGYEAEIRELLPVIEPALAQKERCEKMAIMFACCAGVLILISIPVGIAGKRKLQPEEDSSDGGLWFDKPVVKSEDEKETTNEEQE